MSEKNPTIEENLTDANLVIENSLNDTEILNMVTVFGYNAEKIGEGKTFYEAANHIYAQQKREYGEKFAASSELKAKWDAAHKEFMVQLGVARIVLKTDNIAVGKLGLNERRKSTLSGWLLQTNTFYTNLLSDETLKIKLAMFGITEEKLNAAKLLIDDVETANANHKREKGEAEQATRERDEAIEILDDWISDYKAIAKIALAAKSQLLENLGILAR